MPFNLRNKSDHPTGIATRRESRESPQANKSKSNPIYFSPSSTESGREKGSRFSNYPQLAEVEAEAEGDCRFLRRGQRRGRPREESRNVWRRNSLSGRRRSSSRPRTSRRAAPRRTSSGRGSSGARWAPVSNSASHWTFTLHCNQPICLKNKQTLTVLPLYPWGLQPESSAKVKMTSSIFRRPPSRHPVQSVRRPQLGEALRHLLLRR